MKTKETPDLKLEQLYSHQESFTRPKTPTKYDNVPTDPQFNAKTPSSVAIFMSSTRPQRDAKNNQTL